MVPLGTNILTLAPGRYNVDGVTDNTWVQMGLPVLAWHYEIVVLAAENNIGLINNYKVVIVYPFGYIPEYIESYTNEMRYDGTWTGWAKNTTATPPQQFDLPMAEGLIQSSASWYSKDQFGQVHVHGAISAGSGSLGWDTLVATLPEGYRPGAKIEAPATFASGGKNGSGAVAVSTDGTIKVFPDISSTQKVVYFDLVFLHV